MTSVYVYFLQSNLHNYTTLVLGGQQASADLLLKAWIPDGVEIDPGTGKVKPESIKQDSWSEEVVTAMLAKNDTQNNQKTDDDPTREEMLKIHEEQLKKVQERLKKDAEDAAAKKNN
jgi:hypothetical protein